MARQSVLSNIFAKGELSPRITARVDLEMFYQGAATMSNCLSLVHGGATRRPGSKYVAEVKTSSLKTKLLPFTFATTDSYTIEAGNGYFRFYRAQGQIVSEDTDASITNGDFTSNINDWDNRSSGGSATISHDTANGRLTLDGDGVGTAHAEQDVAIGASFQSTAHVLKFRIITEDEDETGSVTVQVGSTSTGTELLAATAFKNGYHCVEFTPTADATVYIQFLHTANKDHQVDDVSLIDNGAIEIDTPYQTADLFKLMHAQDADTMYIAHSTYKPMKLTRSGHTSWSLTTFAPAGDPFTTAALYPGAVTMFEQRLVFGYNTTNPQRLFFSAAADFDTFTTGTGDTNAFVVDISSGQANPIRWVEGGGDELAIGTTGGVWIYERSTTLPLTFANFRVRKKVREGCEHLRPVVVDGDVFYVQVFGNGTVKGEKLRKFNNDQQLRKWVAEDLTILSEHITDGGIDDMDWQPQGWAGSYESTDVVAVDRVLWAVRSDGVLLSFTYEGRESVNAWARHPMTNGTVETVTVTPGAEGDEVWIIVKRTINGSVVRYVEFLDPDIFLDSGILYSGASATTLTGLDHLEGETVGVLADNAPVADKTVANNEITLTTAVTAAQIGKTFTPEIGLMPLEVGMGDGPSIGAAKSVARVGIRFLNTVGCSVKASTAATADAIEFRDVSDTVLNPIPPFTGLKEVPPPTSWVDTSLTLTQPDPLPWTILGILMEMEAHR